MKKLLVICIIVVSAIGITSAASGDHHIIKSYSVYSDTTPMGMDTTHKKWDKKKMHHKMSKDSGMSMQSDSSHTAPPQK